MHTIEVRLETITDKEIDFELIDWLTSAWRKNGQVMGREFPMACIEDGCRIFVMCPLEQSLEEHHDSEHVTFVREKLSADGVRISFTVLGEDAFGMEPCDCSKRDSFILYTTHTSLESCLRCGDCFGPVPLHAIPPLETTAGELHDKIISWQSDYQACDGLQMGCTTGERFGLREITRHDSSLTEQGVAVCKLIADVTGIPIYYYLFRYSGRSKSTERARKCPSCGGDWLLGEPLHDTFDFKCDRCRLLSNLALSSR